MIKKRTISIILTLFMLTALLIPFSPSTVSASANGDLVINEIAWMGTTVSYADEWIELYNTTGQSISLTGWTLRATDGDPNISLSGSVAPYEYFLLERTDDTSVPNIAANLIYTGSLGNTTETLELRDASGNLIDTVNSWYAGDNTTKATMERTNPLISGTDPTNWSNSTSTYTVGLGTPKAINSNVTGGGTPSGNLEIHHINVGQGDATLIVSPTGKTMLIDAGETYWNSSIDAQKVGPYIESVTGSRNLDYVLITHFHLDHIGYVGYGGLWNLVETQGFTVGKMIHRDYNNYFGTTSGTFDNWKLYLEGSGQSKLNPAVAVEGTSQIDLGGGVVVDIIGSDGNGALIAGNFSTDPNPPSENDYSVGIKISYGAYDEWIGGDFSGQYYDSSFGYSYHDIELSAAKEVGDVDVYRVNHHGSDHSNSATFVNQLDPEVSIISVGDDNTYGHPRQSVMDILLPTSDVYMTERGDVTTNIGDAVVAGDIVVVTDGTTYTVNTTNYTAIEPTRSDIDGDGYFIEVDPNDNSSSSLPLPNGGYDPIYQP